MIGGRVRLALALGLVVATAGVSTATAARSQRATDARLRSAALAAVKLVVVAPGDATIPIDDGYPGLTTYDVPVRNDGSTSVLLRRSSWSGGGARELDQAIAPQQVLVVHFNQPATCPARRTQERIDQVQLEVGVAGGTRTIRLVPSDPSQAGNELNQRCGLFRARESTDSAVSVVRSRPREVTVDVSLQFAGRRPTSVLAVRATDGVTASVAEALPLTVQPTPVPTGNVIRGDTIPRAFTVTLRLTDCAGPRARQTPEKPGEGEFQQPPAVSEIQLTVQHPGDVVEKVNVGIGAAPANALVAGCGLPLLAEPVYS